MQSSSNPFRICTIQLSKKSSIATTQASYLVSYDRNRRISFKKRFVEREAGKLRRVRIANRRLLTGRFAFSIDAGHWRLTTFVIQKSKRFEIPAGTLRPPKSTILELYSLPGESGST